MKFNVILADPPWDFRVWNKDTGNGRSASKHYQTMSINDLCALPVRNVAADNCALFLWTVWPSIFEYVPPLLEAWDFTYRTKGFVWVKARKSGFSFHFGMGYYTRANTEPCLLAVRGKMPVQDHGVSELIYAPIRKHSQKPDEQYTKIERLYPDGNYLELFARQSYPGWTALGNQVGNKVDITEGLRKLSETLVC